jgi:hypothetical protein
MQQLQELLCQDITTGYDLYALQDINMLQNYATKTIRRSISRRNLADLLGAKVRSAGKSCRPFSSRCISHTNIS